MTELRGWTIFLSDSELESLPRESPELAFIAGEKILRDKFLKHSKDVNNAGNCAVEYACNVLGVARGCGLVNTEITPWEGHRFIYPGHYGEREFARHAFENFRQDLDRLISRLRIGQATRPEASTKAGGQDAKGVSATRELAPA